MINRLFFAAMLTVLLIGGGTWAQAADLTVCPSGCDHTTITAAVAAAAAGDTITVAAGIYTEAGITIDKDLTITGAGAGTDETTHTIVQAAANEGVAADRVFDITAGVVALTEMTIRYGVAQETDGSDCPGIYVTCGGGINQQGGSLSVDSCLITQNRLGVSSLEGGGAGISSMADLTIANSTISNNSTDPTPMQDDGGGISFRPQIAGKSLTITNSTIANNTAAHFSGALLLYSAGAGTVSITNCTISGNTATSGAIYNSPNQVDISFSTITNNGAAGACGGIYNGSGTITLINNIIAGNTAGSNPDLNGNFITMGGNLIGDNTGVDGTFPDGLPNGSGDYVGTAGSPLNPLLGPLADNGGPTWTHAPQAGSPAIDMANGGTDTHLNSVTTDQRGYPRPYPDGGPLDIGAFEFGATLPAPSPEPAPIINVGISADGGGCFISSELDR